MPTIERRRKQFGISEFDEMLGGGVWSRSMTTILGAPGVGKTVLGLHFLHEGLKHNEPGLYIGFNETPEWLLDKSERVGINLKPFSEAGTLSVAWEHPGETIPERMAGSLLTTIRNQKIQRVFFDGVDGLTSAFESKERIPTFLAALTNKLRAMDVTALFSEETELFTPEITLQIPALGTLAENIILLRNVELRSQLYRLISMLKVREGDYDTTIREFKITGSGIKLATTFDSAEAVLTGRGVIRPHDDNSDRPLREKSPAKKSDKRGKNQRRPR